MCRVVFSLMRRIGCDNRGAVLLKFTIAILPLMSVAAVALDLSQVLLVKQKLTNAIDAAAIAVGRHPELPDADATILAQSFVQAHYPTAALGDLIAFSVVPTATQVDISATARVPTTFLKVLNYASVDVTVSSRAVRQLRKIELVMVLDNSGSMAGTRLNNLKSAANALVDILFGSAEVSEFVKIGLVPFSGAVNISAGNIGWLDIARLSPIHAEDVDLLPGQTLFDLLSGITNLGWGGCVRARVGPGGYDLTDEPPNPLVGETLFVPYFAPDEPGTGNGPPSPEPTYHNDYIDDSLIPGGLVARQRNPIKYLGAIVPNLGYNPPLGPNYNCPAAPVLPLTNVKTAIKSAISAMAAGGNTVIPEGLAWGWRVLSPGEPFTQGAPYSDPSSIKVLVLLTDGANNVAGNIGHNHSQFSAYGYAASGHLGATDGSQTRQVLDAKTAALCSNIKADKDGDTTNQDIYVYTISFQVTDGATRTMLENCATPQTSCPGGNPCYFHSPTSSALETAFSSIGLGLNELRLSK